MKFDPQNNHRILLIDDNHAIHEDFRKVLLKSPDLPWDKSPFKDLTDISRMPSFEIDSAYQGQEGLDLIEKSLRENRPLLVSLRRCPYAARMGRNRNNLQNLGRVQRSASCHLHSLF
jgi:hypothetical protein